MLTKQKNKNSLFDLEKTDKQGMPKGGRLKFNLSPLWSKILFFTAFAIKKFKLNWFKVLSFVVTIIITVICVLNIAFGLDPLKLLASIGKTKGSSEFVNLYTSQCETAPVSENYHEGWWNVDKISGQPDLSQTGDLASFSEDNSAFYRGGNYNLICRDFGNGRKIEIETVPAMNEDITTAPTEAQEETQADLTNEFPQSEINSEETYNFKETNHKASTTQLNQENNATAASEHGAEEVSDDSTFEVISNSTEEKEAEIKSNYEKGAAEVIEDNGKLNNVEVIKEEETAADFSFWQATLKKAGKYLAISLPQIFAQTNEKIIQESSERPEELGEFKAAKIKVSLAIGSFTKTDDSALEPTTDVKVESAEGNNENTDAAEKVSDPFNGNIQIEEAENSDSLESASAGADQTTTPIIGEESKYLDTGGFFTSDQTVEILKSRDAAKVEIKNGNIDAENYEIQESLDNIEIAPKIETPVDGQSEKASATDSGNAGENAGEPVSINKNIFNFLLGGRVRAQEDSGIEDDRHIVIWYTLDDIENFASSSVEVDATPGNEFIGVNEITPQASNFDDNDGKSLLPPFVEGGISDNNPPNPLYQGGTTVLWQKLGTIYKQDISNGKNGGYLSFNAPFLQNWADAKNLKIKFEGVAGSSTQFVTYLDSVWVEAEFKPAEKESEKMARWKKMLALISNKTSFKYNENLTLKFFYNKKDSGLLDGLGEAFNLVDYWKNVDVQVKLIDGGGEVANLPLTIVFENDGGFTVNSQELPRQFRPGKYKLHFTINDSSDGEEEIIELDQNFIWGVLAFNTNKSIYLPEETAQLAMAVLDNNGNTVCDADLRLEIETPNGGMEILSTDNGRVIRNGECGPNNVIYAPDYYASYYVSEPGIYKVKFLAVTTEGEKEMEDQFEARDKLPFDIARAGPTRIYPRADYQMLINVKANKDYSGSFTDLMPKGFKIVKQSVRIKKANEAVFSNYETLFRANEDEKEIALEWQNINLSIGDEIKINYVFDAPNTSPEFYLLGPAALGDFKEARNWQIASDAVYARSNTVRFLMGSFMGGGAAGTGTSSDANLSLPINNFQLAESGVTIKNAYILFEARYEAYADAAGSSTGYTLAFDACSGGACTPDAYTGSGRVTKVDATNLSSPETESNQVRLLLDITNEAELNAYAGLSGVMRGRVGYRINQAGGPIASFISYAQATLVVTYTYDPSASIGYTNTVIYPLESRDTRGGTKATTTIDDCALNNTCPFFDYNLDIPKFASTTGDSVQLSSWFQMSEDTSTNGTNDITTNVNIQTVDAPSNNFILEATNNNQANHPLMYFTLTGAQGHFEKAARILEYRSSMPGVNPVHNMIGGEVVDTYTASTAAAVKTRTVSFPVGVISPGNTTSSSTKRVDVYFPENGAGSGNVTVKKAWFRVISNNYNSAAYTTSIATKVSTRASTSNIVYNFTPGGTIIQPAFYIFHVIPSGDYAELQMANATTAKTVAINAINNNANQGGTSAELMITYTYTSEAAGYLVNNELFAGQQAVTNGRTQSTTTATASFVAPETRGKTIRAGALKPFYLISDSDGAMTAANVTMDANLSTGAPVCTNSYITRPNGINAATTFYRDVTAALLTADNQAYNACYSHNGAGAATVGAKMNGSLIYTYSWDDTAPTSTFVSASQRSDGTGAVDLSINVNDLDGDNIRVKLEYATGTACVFAPPADPTLDTGNITATYGTPEVDNSHAYQVGTTSGWIITTSGENTVNYDWLTANDIINYEGDFCLRITANDRGYDQATSATTTLIVDNKRPSDPGALEFASSTDTSLTVKFGTASTEGYFEAYKIFYKVYDGTAVTEADFVFSTTSDPHLDDRLYGGFSTTTIGGLTASTTYSLAIWAYDLYGNKASSSKVEMNTDRAPTSTISSITQKIDGSGTMDISIIVDDIDDNDRIRAKIDYVAGSGCNFASPIKALLETNPATINATFGTPVIDNSYGYQLGTTTGWIITSPGENNISFDWLAGNAANIGPGIDATYCARVITNDQYLDQLTAATTTFDIDTLKPTNPVALSQNYRGNDYIILNFGGASTENHFKEYKIYYQVYDGTFVNEADSVLASSTDPNLGDRLFYGYSTTTVGSLIGGTNYSFAIWAYDNFGNKASSSQVEISTRVNNLATSTFESALFRNDGSGIVDIAMKVNDADADDVRVKVEYAANCNFFPSLDPMLANISAAHGTPAIDNDHAYQVGTTTGWIITSSGENMVNFDWLSKNDLETDGATYCLKITANDKQADQITPATTTVYIDNKVPTAPGALSFNSRTNNTITINFGATSTETHFAEYKIFYKVYDGAQVTEADWVLSSSTDPNLHDILFHGIATTSINSLSASTTYSLAIWAYDNYGNRASSSKTEMTTNGAPYGTINSAVQKSNGSGTVNISIMANDPNQDDQVRAKIDYVLGSGCDFISPNQAKLDTSPATIVASQGTPEVDNGYGYQLGTTTDGWILTSDGANTISFDWLALDDLGSGIDATYCIRVTANDQLFDQAVSATTTLIIDTKAPTAPGDLSKNFAGNDYIILNFGATTTENHFKEYKIFYKQGTTGVNEGDSVLSSSTDENLGDILFQGYATTTISVPLPDTYYVFNIWAYDEYGNKANALNEVFYKTNGAPTGAINSLNQKIDGSGEVEISIDVNDVDQDNSRAKIEYVEGADCNFASPLRPVLATTSITADVEPIAIDTQQPYQIGSSTGWIFTLFGSNTVNFNWLSKDNIPLADNTTYCVRLTANDMQADQSPVATTTITIDNQAPTVPGNLAVASTSNSSITLYFGGISSDSNFKEYKLFYKEGSSGVTENDTMIASDTQSYLGFADLQSIGTTTITGLDYNTEYVFNIWAYDQFGNRASATSEIVASTSFILKSQNWQWFHDEDNETPVQAVAPENEMPLTATASPLKLRLTVAETGGAAGSSTKLRLQYSTEPDFLSETYFVGEIGSTTPWVYAYGAGNDNEAVSTLVLTDSIVAGTHNETGSSSSEYFHASSSVAEYEFTIMNNGATQAATYYFRVYDNMNSVPVLTNDGAEYPNLFTYDTGGITSSGRTRTVRFLMGQYIGTGAAGTSSDANLFLPINNFNLAESDVAVRNAYIIFESRFESYVNVAGSSTGYTLAFDTCSGVACTPDPYSGSGRITKVDATNLASPESESNHVRLLLDVTNETQLAIYSGNSGAMRGRVGYRINQAGGPLASFISFAQAVLVVTYTYDPAASDSFTNTVIYPLKSVDSALRGTKATSTADDCGLNSTCPLFNYNMVIPEFVASTSKWFAITESAFGNGANDITVNVNIQGNDTPSANFINESALSDQATQPNMQFFGVAGFAENTDQTLEIRASSAGTPTHNLIGGEVFETYNASSSAVDKTRTTSFPFGIINIGNTTATTSLSVIVYFPENGAGTGTVAVKDAWIRIMSDGYIAAWATTSVTTKVGNNATSTTRDYGFYPATTTIRPTFNIYHVIPGSDYDELSWAGATSSKVVTLATKNSSANQRGLSAELMITYTYTDEKAGYLVNHELFAGQQDVTNGRTKSTTTATANFVAPEARSKTIRGGALKPFYLISDSDGTAPSNNITMDANLATGNPTCTNAYLTRITGWNIATEFYKDITSSLLTTDNQTYNACYSHNGTGAATVGAKMNGTLVYTYQWDDTAPTSTFVSAVPRMNGSGIVDIIMKANDLDGDNLRAKIEYATGTTCVFTSPSNATIDENNITAQFGIPVVDNFQSYQIGTTTGWILTNYGENEVNFNWLSVSNIINLEGDYCLRLTANDRGYDQITPATTTVYIDNKPPTAPGTLSFNSRTNNAIVINFGDTSTETNFKEYKIFYKIYDGTPVTEADLVLSSSTDPNLHDILFHNIATTSINSLSASTTYSLAIWAYDTYGNRASSSKTEMTTNGAPYGTINSTVQKSNGSGTVNISIMANDPNQDNQVRAKIDYVLGSGCDFISSNQAKLDTNPATIVASQGTPEVDNGYGYQLGTTTDGWILTSDGANTISFDWLAYDDLGANIDATYCLRVTTNDQLIDQAMPATTTLTIDTKAPTTPGNLFKNFSGNDYIILNFGATTTENHFQEYKIFYREGTTGVTEGDSVLSSSTDENLGDILFKGYATTTISVPLPDTWYVFNIWAYDAYGNKAQALNEISIKTNGAPTGVINSLTQKIDGSGEVEISIDVNDVDQDNARAKIEYVEGADCNFASPLRPVLATTSIDADIDPIDINTAHAYQIGSSSLVSTLFGSNTINFNWLSKDNIPLADNTTYCVRLTANDAQADQSPVATTTITIDNLAPTTPSNLTVASTSNISVTLYFGSISSDTNFKEYKIFYKKGSAGVTENDTMIASNTLSFLGYANRQNIGTTTIAGLDYNTEYVFNIWAYDQYGNRASATNEVTASTSFIVKSQNWRWYYDYVNATPTEPAALENYAPSTIAKASALKLRLTIAEVGGASGLNTKYRLQYSTIPDFSSETFFVGDIGSSSPWIYANGGGDDNEIITTATLTDSTVLGTHNEMGSSTSVYFHASSTAAEFEFTVRNNGAVTGITYYFRAFDNTNNQSVAVNTAETYPSLMAADSAVTYIVGGLEAGTTTEGVNLDVTSESGRINFGALNFSVAKAGAHRFIVDTNAGNGYKIFVFQRHDPVSSGGATIAAAPGTNEIPSIWPIAPDPSAFGYHTSDITLSGPSPSRFLTDNTYAHLDTLMKEVAYSPIPVTNDSVDLVFRIEASNMQEAGDYQTEIVYILVPNF